MHALFRTQKQLKEENGGRDILSDQDVLSQSRGLIAAGRNTLWLSGHFKEILWHFLKYILYEWKFLRLVEALSVFCR